MHHAIFPGQPNTSWLRPTSRFCFNQSTEEDRMNITRLFKDTLCLQKWLTQVEWDECDAKCLTPCEEVYYDISVASAPWPHITQQMAFYKTYIRNSNLYGNKFDAYEKILNSTRNQSQSQTMNFLRDVRLIRDNFVQLKFVLKSKNRSVQMYLDTSVDVVYSWEACYDTCLQNVTLNKCGCVMPFYQFTMNQLREANYRVCLNQSSEGSNRPNITLAIRDLLCLKEWLTISSVTDCDVKCLLPCDEVYYDISVTSAPWPHISQQMAFYKSYIKSNPNIYGNKFDAYEEVLNSSRNQSETQIMNRLRNINLIRDNFLQLKFVLKSRIPFVLVDQPLMNANSMISSIGGSLSLWLGITVMTFAEVIEFIYTLLVCCYINKTQKFVLEGESRIS